MLLARYFRRECLTTCIVVILILAIVLLGGRVMQYLSYAAEGRLLASLVFQLVLYRSPEFVQMILPLGFFVGILLTLGRWSVERELAVVESAGLSLMWYWQQLSGTTAVLMSLTLLLSVYLTPLGVTLTDRAMAEQAQQAELQALTTGQFHHFSEGQQVVYVGSSGDIPGVMHSLFLAEVNQNNVVAIAAGRGNREVFSQDAVEFLQLRDGRRYELQVGSADAQIIEFQGYRAKLHDQGIEHIETRMKGAPTEALLFSQDQAAKAELHWRLSLPLLVPNVVVLALAMSKVNPRQGRFNRLFPAVILYIVYLGVALIVKSQVAKNAAAFLPVFWGLHLGVFISGMLGLLKADGRLR